MDEDRNDVIDNNEEKDLEVEENVAAQGNIEYQVLENLSVEEAQAFFSQDYLIVSASIYIKSN